MKTTIDNNQEFAATINQYGDALAQIAIKQEEAKALKSMLEAYANATKTWKCTTDAYRFTMKRKESSLRCQPGVTEAAVVSLLKSSETMRFFVHDTYDSAGIKAHARAQENPDEYLAQFGLSLTEPQRHAEIKAIV